MSIERKVDFAFGTRRRTHQSGSVSGENGNIVRCLAQQHTKAMRRLDERFV
jgi:hypothetical protein